MNFFNKKAISWIFEPLPLFGFLQQNVEDWRRFEISFDYICKEDGFTDGNITTIFVNGDSTIAVGGFYDGNNIFRVRFMPSKIGNWYYITHSNIKELNGKNGSFDCKKATDDNYGMVQVSNNYYFKYDDGKQFFPLGTAAYVWRHMSKGTHQLTLQNLNFSGFDKLRMFVFSKNCNSVNEKPKILPIDSIETERAAEGKDRHKGNFSPFKSLFFQIPEKQIDELNKLGLQSDLILFHPYDQGCWGGDAFPMKVNIRYRKYIVAGLGLFRNVWRSMANEWDFLKAKTHSDWIEYSNYMYEKERFHQICSIHGCTRTSIENWLPYYSHANIQDEAPVMYWGVASILWNAYHKSIIYNDVGYEESLKRCWRRYNGEAMTYLMWMGAIGGTNVRHSETYKNHGGNNKKFWVQGRIFRGTFWKQASLRRKILEKDQALLVPANISRDFKTAFAGKGDYIIYLGKRKFKNWVYNIPAKNTSYSVPVICEKYKVEIMNNTSAVTITPVKGIFEMGEVDNYGFYDTDRKKIWLPSKPFLALSVTKIN